MNKMKEIINYLITIETWNSEESFLIDALSISCAKLLLKCHQEMADNAIITIAPILRQVQENIIVIIGLTEGVYTLKNFIEKEHNPKTIMNAVKKKKITLEKGEFELVNSYLFGIKEILNKYSHTNFNGIMTLFTDRFQVPESQMVNKIMIEFIISLLEGPFIAFVNKTYKTEIEMPRKENIQKKLKDVGSLKYVSLNFPDSIKDFINSSEVLQTYYKNIVSDWKIALKEYESLFPEKNNIS